MGGKSPLGMILSNSHFEKFQYVGGTSNLIGNLLTSQENSIEYYREAQSLIINYFE